MYGKGRELEIGNATSAIVISLLRTLVDKGVLSNSEARAVLTRAATALGPHDYTAPVKDWNYPHDVPPNSRMERLASVGPKARA
jgi:hypothetical protein